MLEKGQEVICLILPNHYFLKNKKCKDQWISLLKSVLFKEPIRPIFFQCSIYFVFKFKIINNLSLLTISSIDCIEINNLFSNNLTTGKIYGIFPNEQICAFYFSDLLENPTHIMFSRHGISASCINI